jgi:hypothetical protein
VSILVPVGSRASMVRASSRLGNDIVGQTAGTTDHTPGGTSGCFDSCTRWPADELIRGRTAVPARLGSAVRRL